MVTQQPIPTPNIQHWATRINTSGLTDIAIPLLDILQVWGFVGAQLMWMATPLFGSKITRLAETLEQPETLQQLQQYLLDGNMK